MNYSRALKTLGLIALLTVAGAFVIQAFPGLIGADQALVVQSGSMEPSIPVGSVVFVERVPSEQVDERIHEGDVITFSKPDDRATTTHRVVEKHQAGDSVRFVTKGDANDARDREPVYRGDVVGEVIFNIPYMGYVIDFSNTIYGWFLLVVVPVVALLMDGLWQLYLAIDPEAETEE